MNNAIANVTLIKAGAGAGKTHRIQHTLAGWVKRRQSTGQSHSGGYLHQRRRQRNAPAH